MAFVSQPLLVFKAVDNALIKLDEARIYIIKKHHFGTRSYTYTPVSINYK